MIIVPTAQYQPHSGAAYTVFVGFHTPGPNGETWVLDYDSATLVVTKLANLPGCDATGGAQATPTTVRVVCLPNEILSQISTLGLNTTQVTEQLAQLNS